MSEQVAEVSVLDHGFVRLDAIMADDLSVVNSARVSFHARSEEIGERDAGLINFLMKNRHGTPFEHNSFRFHIAAPIFVFREWQRHRISSYNEWSARYSKLENKFYIPDPENVRIRVGKPGNYTFEPANEKMRNHSSVCLRGIAKMRGMNMSTHWIWTLHRNRRECFCRSISTLKCIGRSMREA
jgi:thymidylate synthase (FAD)